MWYAASPSRMMKRSWNALVWRTVRDGHCAMSASTPSCVSRLPEV